MKIYPYILLTAALLTSCEKDLDFEYRDIEPILVIESVLTQDGASVYLTLTTPTDEPMDRTRLTDAEVTLTDLTTGYTFDLNFDAAGTYVKSAPGETGHEYELVVKRGEEVYRSCSIMSPAVKLNDVRFNWVKMPYDHVAVLKIEIIDADAAAYGDCYWVKVYRNGEIYKWAAITDDSTDENGIISGVMMTSRMDLDEEDDNDALHDGDEIKVTVSHISRRMNDYLVAIESNSNGEPMFDGSFCLGYFLASPVTSVSMTFDRDQIEYYN